MKTHSAPAGGTALAARMQAKSAVASSSLFAPCLQNDGQRNAHADINQH
ncbi:hypothetical protein BURMUCF2_A1281 [Burkholderia multivorans CF2]|nr:hypothetical protein BURMUCF2_A1281 [Burkholderia multivorans CF2]